MDTKVTNEQMQVLLLEFIFKHNISGEELEDLLKLFDVIYPTAFPSSKYLFRKTISSKINYQLHYFCSTCQSLIEVDWKRSMSCDCKINTKFKENYFVIFSVKDQVKLILEEHNTSILKKSELCRIEQLSDILSGQYVKNLVRADVLSDEDITLLGSLDGAQAFKSSSRSYWPFFATINELQHKSRNSNMILLGLWFGKNKPCMETYLKAVLDEVKNYASDYFQWSDVDRKIRKSHVFLLMCTCDAVAQAAIRNCHQFNGEYGCPKYYHKGKRVEKGDGFVSVYPFLEETPSLRNAVSHLEDCRNAVEKDVPVYGVKGPRVLQTVPTFDPVNSFVFEYMHCVQGICRSLLSLWLDTCNCRNSYYLGRHLLLLDKELTKIEPPNEITRLPNSLSARKY